MTNPKGFFAKKLQELSEAAEWHTWNNRLEIEASAICMCAACHSRFPPSAIRTWQDGSSAVCPNPDCLFGGSVLGAASGLNFDDYDYSQPDA